MAGSKTVEDGTAVGKDTKVTKDQTQLLADAREAGQEAVDAVLNLIPEVEHRLPPVYPRIDVASVLTISHHHTEEVLQNVHTKISELGPGPRGGSQTGGVFLTLSYRSPAPSGTRWTRWL